MNFWCDKFEPIITNLLKTKKTSLDSDELNFYRSKLDLDKYKSKIFDILTELHYCDCCIKHQYDKPCIPTKWISKKIPTQQTIDCLCDCRHTARMICRMCD